MQRVRAGGNLRERAFQRGARLGLDELVRIQSEHEIGTGARKGRAREGAHVVGLVERLLAGVAPEQRKAFCLERCELPGRRIRGAMVEQRHAIHEREVVAHERLDDVLFVAPGRPLPARVGLEGRTPINLLPDHGPGAFAGRA